MASARSPRARCSVFIATSVDGYIARQDGSVDWLEAVARPGEDYGYQAFFDSIDALVMGRNTYETVAARADWPYTDTPVLVLTRRPVAPRAGVTFAAGEPAQILARLGAEGVRHVYVDGGDVVRQFLAAGLIDDLTLSVVPVLLGDGLPLFGSGTPQRALELEDVASWPSGLVQLRYRVA